MEKDLSLDLFIVLSRAYKAVAGHSEQDIRRSGLNPTEFGVLELLYHKGPHPLQQIGEKILLASGSITYVVDKLEQKGLLERKTCAEDRRITFASITEQGSQLMNDIFPQHVGAIQAAVAGLSDEEKETAIHLLKKLGKHAQNSLS